jgi:hypothetical protein
VLRFATPWPLSASRMTALPQSITATGKWLHREFVAARPVFIFFLVAFLLQFLIIKLALAQFSVPVTAFSKAVIGALFAAKAVLIIDETPLGRSLERYRRIVAVAVKTLLYGFGTLLLGYLERFLEALHRTASFDAAVRQMIEQSNVYRFLAWVLGVTLIFAIYFVWSEINEHMGEGAIWSLFFDKP